MTKEEQLFKAKIPGPETGIEIRRTMCDICTPGAHCGVNAYVKDGRLLKVEGTPGYPGSNGKLCTKGAANRQYIYRKDRILSPMVRTGPKGSDEFRQATWEEALTLIADNLKKIKAESDPDSIVWYTGYSKWYRPWLKRLCHSFGGHNYMTESSTCYKSGWMASNLIFGSNTRPDMGGNPQLIVGWGSNPYINAYLGGRGYAACKAAGVKIIIIDVRRTQASEKLADLYLRPRIGTDGVLAHAMAKVILDNGWQDQPFLDQYVLGFAEYRDMVSQYDLDTAERITGVPKEDIYRAARMIAEAKPCSVSTNTGITHHKNGLNTCRAILALNVITGNVDKPGGILPTTDTFLEMGAGFETREEEFIFETRTPERLPLVGQKRFPLWYDMNHDGQAMDLTRHILTEDPYPIRALAAFGMNTRMFPQTSQLLKALEKLDFMFATDLFWTDACRYADVVLPACSSFERGEVKCYPGGFMSYTQQAIDRVGDCRSDVEIIAQLAKRLDTGDELLMQGYDACIRYIFEGNEEELTEARRTGIPVRSKMARPTPPGSYLANGANTPSGKLELYSIRIANLGPETGLDPLPVWFDGDNDCDKEEYPFTLMAGARIPNAIHSRCHNVPWLRSLRPDPMVDIHPEDAKSLGISQGDPVALSTTAATLHLRANLTLTANRGELHMFHGYEEANANELVPNTENDPYSGFPSFKQIRCRIEKDAADSNGAAAQEERGGKQHEL